MYHAKHAWEKHFLNGSIAWPSEYVIRIFKGQYPRLSLTAEGFHGKKVCDVGCGDGRNLVVLQQCGLELYGTEITGQLAKKAESNLQSLGISRATIQTGTSASLPFEDKYFDYLLSWNSCYYMDDLESDFNQHIEEFCRTLKEDGTAVLSVPKSTNFIYKDSRQVRDGYWMIQSDPFGVRNGEILRRFKGEEELENTLLKYFQRVVLASIHDDCFGLNYHWHMAVCQGIRRE